METDINNKTKVRIKVYGSEGYVGRAVVNLLQKHYIVYKIDKGIADRSVVNEKVDLAVVCVPTPINTDGTCDISIVEDVVSSIAEPLILIKSTIPPGTTERLKFKYNKSICFSPEYIGEGNYEVPFWKGYPHPTDMRYHGFQIFGGSLPDTKKLIQIFQKVLGADCRYYQTSSTTAEFVKYLTNAWLATKVTFCNEIYDMAEDAFGLDYNEIRELWLLDGRVTGSHTAVFENDRGFGGKCFPKDLCAFINVCRKKGKIPYLLEAVNLRNQDFRALNRRNRK